ncbi:MAG: hypothetical protein ACKO1J_01305 [Tagaea sp.]
MLKISAFCLIALALSGCVAQEHQVRANTGQVIGAAELRDITAGESPLSIDRGEAWDAAYRQRRFNTRTSTYVSVRGGSLIMEVSGTNEMFGLDGETATRAIDQIFAPRLTQAGIRIDRGSRQTGRSRIGRFTSLHASDAAGREHCFLFEIYPQALLRNYDNGAMYSGYIAGVLCGRDTPIETISAEGRRLIDALHYDGGALNRAQARLN